MRYKYSNLLSPASLSLCGLRRYRTTNHGELALPELKFPTFRQRSRALILKYTNLKLALCLSMCIALAIGSPPENFAPSAERLK